MKKLFKLTDEEFAEIIKINKEGGDCVMYGNSGQPFGSGSGGKFLSLQAKVNSYWDKLGEKYNFDWETIQSISNREFYAEEKNNGRTDRKEEEAKN